MQRPEVHELDFGNVSFSLKLDPGWSGFRDWLILPMQFGTIQWLGQELMSIAMQAFEGLHLCGGCVF